MKICRLLCHEVILTCFLCLIPSNDFSSKTLVAAENFEFGAGKQPSERNTNELPKEPHYGEKLDRRMNPKDQEGFIERERRFGPTRKPAPSRPSYKSRKEVDWYEGSRAFALKVSNDQNLLLRHAPIPQDGSPWPMPQTYQSTHHQYIVNPNRFKIVVGGVNCDVLQFAINRTYVNTFVTTYFPVKEDPRDEAERQMQSEELNILNVTVKKCQKYPSLEINEKYDLKITSRGATIFAKEVWGALRGLETFSQLVYHDDYGNFVVNKTNIHDFPRFPHRGVHLDTARHFLSKETIIENLEAMAQNKINVFHWHIVDDQSFPFQSKVFPSLSKYGAYDPETHVYTHQDIHEILEEARLRGIRVIPEFDTPGHTYAWGMGQDNLLTPCYNYQKEHDGTFGPLNPILKSTYFFLQELFQEVLTVFKDKYVHLGGDEVPFDCWLSNPQIMNFVQRNNLTGTRELLGLYEKKLLDIVTELGKKRNVGSGYIVWQEVFDNGVKLKPDTVVQIWKGDSYDVMQSTNSGYRTLFSSCWYLDWIGYGQDWDKYYRCDALFGNLGSLRNESLLIGGEICLWTEYADDRSITPRLWPRASAAAERLWSSKYVNNDIEAGPRIEEQRCRMIRRGIKVGVLSGPGYCRGETRKKKPQPPKYRRSLPIDRDFEPPHTNGPVVIVDMNSMYLIPLLIVLCILCLTLQSVIKDTNKKNRILSMLAFPGSSRKGVRGLVLVFIVFITVWCVWTAPLWLNGWEMSSKRNMDVRKG